MVHQLEACYAWYVLLTVGDGRKQAEPQSRLSLSPPATNTLHEPRSSRTSDVSMGRGSRLTLGQALAGSFFVLRCLTFLQSGPDD